MEVFLQLMDEIDDAVTVLAHGAMALETRLARLSGGLTGLAALLVAGVGLVLGIGA